MFCNVFFVAVDAMATPAALVLVGDATAPAPADAAAATAAIVAADINRLIEFQSGLPGCISSAAVDS